MGGFGAVVTMPNTDPPCDSLDVMQQQISLRKEAMAAAGKPLPVIMPACAMTKRRAGREPVDFAELIKAGCVLFTDDGDDVADDDVLRAVMLRFIDAYGETSIDTARPRLMFHAQSKEMMHGGVMHEGAVSVRLGVPGIPRESEDMAVERAVRFGLVFHLPVHITHVTTMGAVEIIRRGKDAYAAAGLKGYLTSDVTSHHLTFTDEDVEWLGALAKSNPPLREAFDRDALRAGLLGGTIDCIATDHAPHTAGEKSQGLMDAPFGITGLEIALSASLNAIGGGMEKAARVLRALTGGPSALIGAQKSAGVLAESTLANLCVYDPAEEWRVEPSQFAGKCKVSPYAGMMLRGRIKAVILSGALAWGELPGAEGAV